MTYCFEVEGRPPVNRNLSMWGQEVQFESLRRIRQAAANCIPNPLHGDVGISVIFEQTVQPQDIDNMLPGLLNALSPMANNAVVPDEIRNQWVQEDQRIQPEAEIAYYNDAQVVEMFVRRVRGESDRYRVLIYQL